MITPTTLLEILQHHLNGGLFRYSSYDHKQAEAEYRLTQWFIDHEAEYNRACNPSIYGPLKVSKHEIPVTIRSKHQIWRRGKLRKVEFLNNGAISRVYIGSKYALPVYERDCSDIVQLVKD